MQRKRSANKSRKGLDAEPIQKLLEGLTFQALVSNDDSVRPMSAHARWRWSPNGLPI
jgi:hypothetical protein